MRKRSLARRKKPTAKPKKRLPVCRNPKLLYELTKETCEGIYQDTVEAKKGDGTIPTDEQSRLMIESVGDGHHFWWTNHHAMCLTTGEQLVATMQSDNYSGDVLEDIPSANGTEAWLYNHAGIFTTPHYRPTQLLADEQFKLYVQGYTTPWAFPTQTGFAALIGRAPGVLVGTHVKKPLFYNVRYMRLFRKDYWKMNVLIKTGMEPPAKSHMYLYYPDIDEQPAGCVMPLTVDMSEITDYFERRDK